MGNFKSADFWVPAMLLSLGGMILVFYADVIFTREVESRVVVISAHSTGVWQEVHPSGQVLEVKGSGDPVVVVAFGTGRREVMPLWADNVGQFSPGRQVTWKAHRGWLSGFIYWERVTL